MQWITDKTVFEEILKKARVCEKADVSDNVGSMDVLRFESMELLTRGFLKLIQSLMARSEDDVSYYLTMDPDPINYFATTFARYPLVELSVNDSSDKYLATFNEEIGNSPANALGTNWWKYVVLPKSNKWFIVGSRDFNNDTNGLIWCPRGWSQWVKNEYPSAIDE